MESTCKIDYPSLILYKQVQGHLRQKGIKVTIKELLADAARLLVINEEKVVESHLIRQSEDPLEKYLAYNSNRQPAQARKFNSAKDHDLVL